MQRRAAAAYVALFLVLGLGAYGFIQVGMTQPTVDLPGEAYGNGSSLTVGGTTYVVQGVGFSGGGGGGHGGGGGATHVATLTWTDADNTASATVSNDSTFSSNNQTWRVLIANVSDPSEATLEQPQNVTAILAADDAVENQTVTIDGEEHVVFRANDTVRPLADYLPDPETTTVAEGDTLAYDAESGSVDATVANVTSGGVVFEWNAPADREAELAEGANVTLSGTQFFAHFPEAHAVQILETSQHYPSYQEQLNTIDYWGERRAGLWGITILSALAIVILLPAAYMPVRS